MWHFHYFDDHVLSAAQIIDRSCPFRCADHWQTMSFPLRRSLTDHALSTAQIIDRPCPFGCTDHWQTMSFRLHRSLTDHALSAAQIIDRPCPFGCTDHWQTMPFPLRKSLSDHALSAAQIIVRPCTEHCHIRLYDRLHACITSSLGYLIVSWFRMVTATWWLTSIHIWLGKGKGIR